MTDSVIDVEQEHTSSNEETQMVSRNSIIEAQHEHTSSNDEIQMLSTNSSPTHLVPHSQQTRTSYTYSPQANTKQQHTTAEVVDEFDEDSIETTNEISSRFIHVVFAGDDKKAVKIFQNSPQEVFKTRIGRNGETAFHMAVLAAREEKVANVVKKILSRITETPSELLAFGTNFGTNALHYAAASGNTEIARIIHQKNPNLADMENNIGLKPIILAALAGHSDVIKFLLGTTTFAEDDHHGSSLLKLCIKSGLFDIAVDMVHPNRCPYAATWVGVENEETALEVLAGMQSPIDQKHCSYVNKLLNQIWPDLKRSTLYKTSYLQKLLLTAAENGNHDLIVFLLGHYPGLIYTIDTSTKHTIFHIAIVHRHEKIFTLIHEIGSMKDYIATYLDDKDNSMLHLAAELSPPDQLNRIHGAALQMQRELLWYKEVEKIVPPGYVNLQNSDKKMPRDIFNEKHLALMESGEKWMKRTTQFSMVVATLIATVVFTTAFTIPGGVNNNGAPNFIWTKCFNTFVISEILAMFFSSISIVMYLSILSSRYTEKDFLTYLPLWLSIGTTTLLISLTSMLVAFCNAFLVFQRHDQHYMLILLSILALAPLMFILVNFPLLVDIFKTTRSSKSLSRSCRKLFLRNGD